VVEDFVPEEAVEGGDKGRKEGESGRGKWCFGLFEVLFKRGESLLLLIDPSLGGVGHQV
jgi:hypothetical protein